MSASGHDPRAIRWRLAGWIGPELIALALCLIVIIAMLVAIGAGPFGAGSGQPSPGPTGPNSTGLLAKPATLSG